MLTTLLATSKKVEVTSISSGTPKIEVVPDVKENNGASDGNDEDVFEVQEMKFDWTEKGTCTYEVMHVCIMNTGVIACLVFLIIAVKLHEFKFTTYIAFYEPTQDQTSIITEGLQSYGFTGHHSGVFVKLKASINSTKSLLVYCICTGINIYIM